MKYYWKITKVHLDSLKDEVGIDSGDATINEPLWDFGTPNAGCTYIKINGEIV